MAEIERFTLKRKTSISIDPALWREARLRAKRGKFKSLSSYIEHLIMRGE